MNEILDFFNQLRANNNREWFAANRDRYLHVKARCEAFASSMIDQVAIVDPRAKRLSVDQCTYRIYRDTRFSPDKSPYKTHYGVFVNPPGGKKALTMGYYFHLEPGNCFLAAGTVCLPSRLMTMLRQAIRDEIEEYVAIVRSEEFRRLFPHYGQNPLKTAPKGFPHDWPYLDLVRPREMVVSTSSMTSVFSRFIPSPSMQQPCTGPSPLTPYLQQAARFNRFMNYTIEEYDA